MANQFQKYYRLFLLSWQNGLVYRASLLVWRLRQIILSVMSLTLWQVIYTDQTQVSTYNRAQMTSYIFMIALLQSLILASSLNGLAGDIYHGKISAYFLKPQRMFWTFLTFELADKFKNLVFALSEGVLLFFIFRPELIFPPVATWLLFILWSLGGAILFFYITILFGCLGFWSPETWGPRFLFFMILEFTVGRLFPLDLLPTLIQTLLRFTPFPYLSYVQIQLFLGRLDSSEIWWHSLGLLTWIVIFWQLASRIWEKGAHGYEASGQ